MEIKELLDFLNRRIPAFYACDWDNSGLQVGHMEKQVNKVYIALDATEDVVYDACVNRCDFILTHHPLLFKGIKQVTDKTSIGRKLYMLIGNDIAVFSAHTNYDAMPDGMGDSAAALMELVDVSPLEPMNDGLEDPWGIGVVGNLMNPVTLADFCDMVKENFGLKHVNLFAAGDMEDAVQRVAICPGSGRSMFNEVIRSQADVFLSGDIGHHEGLDLVDMGISVVDAGHFGLEHIFVPIMANMLSEAFPELEILTAKPVSPFKVL